VKVSVIIPTLNAAGYLPRLLPALRGQTLPPAEIILMDSSSADKTAELGREAGCIVEVIDRSEFNHGGTRNRGAARASGEVLVFMTQDVSPADERFIEELTRPIREKNAAAAYARQIPYPDAPPPEAFARNFNYPEGSFSKRAEDIPRMGIKAYFFSDAASAVSKADFDAVGRFPEHVIVNEDMWLCAKLLQSGRTVSYAAEARAMHSHHYTLRQQFTRYFDIGVFMRQSREVLQNARSGGEGVRFLGKMIGYLARRGAWFWIPYCVIESGVKFTAFRLGIWEHLLPLGLKRRFSMHSRYWARQQ